VSEPRRGPRVPQVNLLSTPSRGFRTPIPPRYMELILIVFVILVWGAVGVGIAILFGWRPHLGLGP
jgi:hypothetical protein